MAAVQSRLKTYCLIFLLVLWAALSFSSALVEISFAFAVLIYFFLILKKYKNMCSGISSHKIAVLYLLGFVILSVLSIFWSENHELSIRGSLKVLQQVMIFGMVFTAVNHSKDFQWFERVFLSMLVLLAVNGIYQYFTGRDFIRGFEIEAASSGPRITASFKSYGLLASYLISTIPLLFAILLIRMKEKSRAMKIFALAALLILNLALLYWTRSRGAFVAFALGTTVILILLKFYRVLLALLVAGALFLVMLPRSMVIHLDAEGKEQSLVERYYLWDRAVQVIQAKPLTGTGINTYASTHAKYDKTQNWRVRNYYAHNGYLQMAAETGVASLLFFLAFLFYYMSRNVNLSTKTSEQTRILFWGVTGGLFNFIILASVDTVLHNPLPAMTFWYLLGLQGAIVNDYKTSCP